MKSALKPRIGKHILEEVTYLWEIISIIFMIC
jgi:hypothetical protein